MLSRLTLVLCILYLPAAAKKDDRPTSFTPTTVTAGTFTSGAQPVKGIQYTLPYAIVKVDEDTAGNLVMMTRQIKGEKYGNKGHLLSLEPGTGTVNWLLNIQRFGCSFTSKYALYPGEDGTRVFDKYTGKYQHTMDHEFQYFSYWQNRGVTDKTHLIDIGTNKRVWKSELKIPQPWQEIKRLTDSTVLVSANGIHFLNLYDGTGWNYRLSTTKDDYSAAIGVAVAGIAIAALGSPYTVIPTGSDHITGLSSNILVDTDDSSIYYSSKNFLIKVSQNGDLLWEQELIKKESSTTYMWLDGDRLIKINRGMAYLNGIAVDVGLPYIAAYDRNSGKQIYIRKFLKGEGISTFYSTDHLTLMRFGDQLSLFDHEDGKQIAQRPLTKKEKKLEVVSGLLHFIQQADGRFTSVSDQYPEDHFFTDGVQLHRMSKQLNTVDTVNYEDVWKVYDMEDGAFFLSRKNELAVVKSGNLLARFEMPGYFFITQNKLLLCDEEKITVVQLADIL